MIVYWIIISIFVVAVVLLWLYAFRKERRVKKVYRIIKRTHKNLYDYDGVLPNADIAVNWIDQIQTLEKIPTKELTKQHIYILLKLYEGLYQYATTGSILHKPIEMSEEKLTRMLILRACFEKNNSFTFENPRDAKIFNELLKAITEENSPSVETTAQNQNKESTFQSNLNQTHTTPKTSPKKESSAWAWLSLLVILMVLIVIPIAICYEYSYKNTYNFTQSSQIPSQSTTTTKTPVTTSPTQSSQTTYPTIKPSLTPVAEPISGTILEGRERYNASEITVTASHSEACVVKLKDLWGDTVLSFYVRAGQTATVGVPAQRLYVYFASGKTWYGKEKLFGFSTSYSKDDESLDFENYTCTYTLYPVTDGNFTETPIDEDEFFD